VFWEHPEKIHLIGRKLVSGANFFMKINFLEKTPLEKMEKTPILDRW
jgi:hypothetical protein